MAHQRLSATIEEDLLAAVRARVGPRGLSSFVNRALRFELERAQLADLVTELHHELGPPTDEELSWASEVLAKPAKRSRSQPEKRGTSPAKPNRGAA
jgi:hypothetical protein